MGTPGVGQLGPRFSERLRWLGAVAAGAGAAAAALPAVAAAGVGARVAALKSKKILFTTPMPSARMAASFLSGRAGVKSFSWEACNGRETLIRSRFVTVRPHQSSQENHKLHCFKQGVSPEGGLISAFLLAKVGSILVIPMLLIPGCETAFLR